MTALKAWLCTAVALMLPTCCLALTSTLPTPCSPLVYRSKFGTFYAKRVPECTNGVGVRAQTTVYHVGPQRDSALFVVNWDYEELLLLEHDSSLYLIRQNPTPKGRRVSHRDTVLAFYRLDSLERAYTADELAGGYGAGQVWRSADGTFSYDSFEPGDLNMLEIELPGLAWMPILQIAVLHDRNRAGDRLTFDARNGRLVSVNDKLTAEFSEWEAALRKTGCPLMSQNEIMPRVGIPDTVIRRQDGGKAQTWYVYFRPGRDWLYLVEDTCVVLSLHERWRSILK